MENKRKRIALRVFIFCLVLEIIDYLVIKFSENYLLKQDSNFAKRLANVLIENGKEALKAIPILFGVVIIYCLFLRSGIEE